MSIKELTYKLASINQDHVLYPVCALAIQLLSQAHHTMVEISDSSLSVEYLLQISTRRLARLNEIGVQVTGLEQSINNLTAVPCSVTVGTVAVQDKWIYLWFDESVDIVGCMVG